MIFDHNVLVLCKIVIRVEESNVDRLLSVDFVSILAESLPDLELCNDTLVMLKFVLDLVWTFGS